MQGTAKQSAVLFPVSLWGWEAEHVGGTAPLGLQAPHVLAASVRPSAGTGGEQDRSRLIPARGVPGPVSCTPRVSPLARG